MNHLQLTKYYGLEAWRNLMQKIGFNWMQKQIIASRGKTDVPTYNSNSRNFHFVTKY